MPITWKPDHAKPNNFAAWEAVIYKAGGPAIQVTVRQVGNSWCVEQANRPSGAFIPRDGETVKLTPEDFRAVVTLALLREDYPVIECP